MAKTQGKTVAVTGAAGYIGGRLIELLETDRLAFQQHGDAVTNRVQELSVVGDQRREPDRLARSDAELRRVLELDHVRRPPAVPPVDVQAHGPVLDGRGRDRHGAGCCAEVLTVDRERLFVARPGYATADHYGGRIAYAVLGLVDNLANGLDAEPLTLEAYEARLEQNRARAGGILGAIIAGLHRDGGAS